MLRKRDTMGGWDTLAHNIYTLFGHIYFEDICQFYSYVEHKEWNLDILFDSLRVPQSRGPEHFCDFGPSK